MIKKIKLIFSGSGMLYPCHAGAAIRLAEAGHEFEEVCGVSGGSIIAAALASGYKPNSELVNLIKNTLPAKNNAVDFSLFSMFNNWGLIKGDKIEKMLETYMAKTFADTKIPLRVVATNVSRKERRVFTSKTDPSMPISKAVRASMSIPFIFAPVDWGGEKYVDGGWISNFPLDIFGDADNVIGSKFRSDNHEFHKVDTLPAYVVDMIDTAISSNVEEDIEDVHNAKYISIVSKHKSLDFNANDKSVDDMIHEGWVATDKWFKAQ